MIEICECCNELKMVIDGICLNCLKEQYGTEFKVEGGKG